MIVNKITGSIAGVAELGNQFSKVTITFILFLTISYLVVKRINKENKQQ